MNKALVIMAVITVALVAYAFHTAQIPPASIEYKEVFYVDNQSVTFVTKDGVGLFTMRIEPHVDSFELKIAFPKGTSYLVRYGDMSYRGSDEFRIQVEKDSLPGEVYVQFQLPPELTKEIVYQKGQAEILITGDKIPMWHAEDVIYIKYRKESKS
ncbi:hypothetical protein APY94_06375 [Thermococcus celericrescens]|uniref:Uncharacterized protein n=1 Tax=Thermococcus celericrescens TaxID=227598 RepID=A0A100XXV8_9EURY|nr:hypothetical protein [Thermococcus celericrescens]KUH33360.1 hypothetical protein APY94_06375 [Thermococcus celericrescens]